LQSIQTIKEVLNEFEGISGLKANPSKSSVFCASVPREEKEGILEFLKMTEVTLPVRYLGVPRITTRLSAEDCEILIGKAATRIDSWLAKLLSFAGRLQLIPSVLYSLQVLWASVFILPKKVINILEQKPKRFLWSGNDSTKAKAKVA
jgi:hypothetical protein